MTRNWFERFIEQEARRPLSGLELRLAQMTMRAIGVAFDFLEHLTRIVEGGQAMWRTLRQWLARNIVCPALEHNLTGDDDGEPFIWVDQPSRGINPRTGRVYQERAFRCLRCGSRVCYRGGKWVDACELPKENR